MSQLETKRKWWPKSENEGAILLGPSIHTNVFLSLTFSTNWMCRSKWRKPLPPPALKWATPAGTENNLIDSARSQFQLRALSVYLLLGPPNRIAIRRTKWDGQSLCWGGNFPKRVSWDYGAGWPTRSQVYSALNDWWGHKHYVTAIGRGFVCLIIQVLWHVLQLFLFCGSFAWTDRQGGEEEEEVQRILIIVHYQMMGI